MSAQSATPEKHAQGDRLGGTLTLGGDMTVRRLGFGAMRLCGPGVWGDAADRTKAKRVLGRVVELGITLIDTADAYGPEVNESLIAETLHPYPPDEIVIATKGGLTRPRREAWDRNGRPEHLRAACEGSLRRLRLQRIDLYQLHAPDPRVPFEDSVGALADLQAAGKIRHIGLSNVSLGELRRAQQIAPIVSVQNRYNFSDRSPRTFSPSVTDRVSLSSLGIPWMRVAPAAARSRKSRADMAPRQCKWRSAGCWPARGDGANSRHFVDRASRRERGGCAPAVIGGRPAGFVLTRPCR